MLNTKKPVQELKEILMAMNFFNEVSVGKVKDLTAETNLPNIYIKFENDINRNNGKMTGASGDEYDRMLAVTLELHLDLTGQDDLYYLDVRDMVEEAILKDSQLWSVVIDRDVVGSKWDSGANLPLKQGEMGLILFTRACLN